MTTIFVTATDTDAGKTAITSAILYGLQANGKSCLGYKPIAAGANYHDGVLINDDAVALATNSSVEVTSSDINPVCFAAPIAPHIAAQQDQQNIDLKAIDQHFCQLNGQHPTDVQLVEGAGGWRLPLNLSGDTLAQWPSQRGWPVILVVGLKLGCLNHALLTVEAISQDDCHIVGWVGNTIDPTMSMRDENIASLNTLLPAPCLGIVPYLDEPSASNIWPYIAKGLINP
ncbi:ATP-dependent dethiobiotin synthetase BioD [Neiella marina]|uniref:ATP-dependent dethiobiotin synthetase BioD n=1 Tax=Neiella marina TaxID=508461 RepID=A0A8J2XP74_9GAMM|nr:dethiobiotin synthase [Neiella marina]GGA77801.1 ATP-dependent dethiobiotin synthetase BioD [Neiella marina]